MSQVPSVHLSYLQDSTVLDMQFLHMSSTKSCLISGLTAATRLSTGHCQSCFPGGLLLLSHSWLQLASERLRCPHSLVRQVSQTARKFNGDSTCMSMAFGRSQPWSVIIIFVFLLLHFRGSASVAFSHTYIYSCQYKIYSNNEPGTLKSNNPENHPWMLVTAASEPCHVERYNKWREYVSVKRPRDQPWK